jgi:hypothetical protein
LKALVAGEKTTRRQRGGAYFYRRFAAARNSAIDVAPS